MATNNMSEEPESAPGATPGSKQAKAAFEEYRQRMWATHGPHAHAYPHHPGMHPWPPQSPSPPPAEKGSGASLIEGIGTMIRLGVELINLGLQGGTQLLQGVYGPAGHMGHEFPEGCHECGQPHGRHCLYGCHCCDACYPGVHNCAG